MCLPIRLGWHGYEQWPVLQLKDTVIQWVEHEISCISVLLEEVEAPRRVTDDRVRHCLAFMRMELSAMAAVLKSSTYKQRTLQTWGLEELQDASLWVSSLYDMHGVEPPPTLLRRAARRCRCSRGPYRIPVYYDGAVRSYRLFKDPYSYQLRFLSPSYYDLGLLDPNPPDPATVEYTEATVAVGIDGPAQKLLAWATDTDENLRVISIVGPAGIGKTTLAMEFHRRLLQIGNFQCCAVAQMRRDREVPDYVTSNNLLLQILWQVLGSAAPRLSPLVETKELCRLISEHLQVKRYFVLIDDIIDISYWRQIKGAFPNDKCGSRILVTTSITSIARSCCSNYDELVHEMEPLSKSDSERLLLTKVFGMEDQLPRNNVKLICDEILRRCEGIPLFITCMADWLKEELKQQEVHKQSSALYCVEKVPKLLKQFEESLSPTYIHLPYNLKLLLLYMASIFPQGYLFKKDSLIMKWLSHEGLTQSWYVKGKDDEEEAEKHFSELVNRNIITPVAANQRQNDIPDEAVACQWKISYYMSQFLASISADKGFAFTSCTFTSTAVPEARDGDMIQTPRRIALHHPNPELSALLQTMDLSQIRFLVVSGAVDQIPLDKFLYLVVLDLQGWENLKDEDMLQICSNKMCLLQHLSIRNTPVRKLPIEIKELCSLRTLDASHTEISEIPTQIKDLGNLRTLDVSHTQITELPTQIKDLVYLSTLDVSHTHMSELPPEVYMLKKLRRLDIRNTQIRQIPQYMLDTRRLSHILVGDETALKIPERMKLSDNLKTLATIDLSEHPASLVKDLGGLINLRVLGITWSFRQCTDEDYCEALLSSIIKWRKLKSLTIHCEFSCCMDFLSSLSDPPMGLQKLKVTVGTFTRVPEWIDKLSALSFVQMTLCKLVTDDLKKLGSLPKLHCLVLGLEFIPIEEIVIGSEGFHWLFSFSVNCAMPWLSFREGAMWRLECLELKVYSGPASRDSAVPSGLVNLGSLTEVVVHYNQEWCGSSSSVTKTVEAVKKEVAKHCNPINLVINGTTHDVQQIDEKTVEASVIQSEV